MRDPGLDAIRELIGETPLRKRPGRKRAVVATRREDIPAEKFPPFWRAVLPYACQQYGRRCAYLALYMEHATGNPGIDHYVPKSERWDLVYEWSNYRLASGLANSRKSKHEPVLDPFVVQDDWFEMEFVSFQLVPTAAIPPEFAAQVANTLGAFNSDECCKARGEYVTNYEQRRIRLSHVVERAPHVARELHRQGRLHPEDR